MKTESLPNFDSEDIFAKAIERVEAGEPIEAVLATAPAALQAELREVLLLITATHHLHRAPVPQPPAPRRADRKKAFLAAAAQMKAEAALDTPPVVTPVPVAKAQTRQTRQAKAQSAGGLAAFWRNFLDSFTSPNFSLAPLAVLIIAVCLGAFGFSKAAQAAKIGDFTYPVKQWLNYQALSLSPAPMRPDAYQELEIRLAQDVTNAKAELSAEEGANGRKVAIITTESFLVVKGGNDGYLQIGPLNVLMQYQPDPNVERYEPMLMSGIPSFGSQVELTFQIIANEETPDKPLAVQGRALRVITEGQLTFDNSQAKNPVPVAPTPTACNVVQPTGWVPVPVESGEQLTAVAERTGATLAELIAVNCLGDSSKTIPADMMLILAPQPLPTSTPTPTEPVLEVTLTVYAEKTLTPSIEMTATVVPSSTAGMTATVIPTTTAAITVTPEVTGTAIVTGTTEPTTTITATVVPTATVIPTPTVDTTPNAPITVTATTTVALTGQPTENTELKGTLTATAPISDGVELPTGTPIAPPVTATSTPTAPPTAATPAAETATAAPTSEQAATAVATPTASTNTGSGTTGQAAPTVAENTSDSTPGIATPRPLATATPVPQSKSPLTGG